MSQLQHLLTILLSLIYMRPRADALSVHDDDAKKGPVTTFETDILIIGGGSTGTYAAVQLSDQGHDVLLVEKTDRLGGHVDTYRDPATGAVINVGVQVFHNTSVVRSYFSRLNVSLGPLVPPPAPRTVYADFATGAELPPDAAAWLLPNETAVAAALERYAAYLAANYLTLDEGYDQIPDPVPDDLAVLSFAELAESEGFGDAVRLVNRYAAPADVTLEPALYALKSFGPAILRLVRGDGPLATRDTADLYGVDPGTGIAGVSKVYFASFDPPVSVKYAQRSIRESLRRMAASGVIGPGEMEVLGRYDHSPTRLSVLEEDIAKGFYKELYALQGKRSTWSGAAWQTQDSGQIWEFTQRLLERVVEA